MLPEIPKEGDKTENKDRINCEGGEGGTAGWVRAVNHKWNAGIRFLFGGSTMTAESHCPQKTGNSAGKVPHGSLSSCYIRVGTWRLDVIWQLHFVVVAMAWFSVPDFSIHSDYTDSETLKGQSGYLKTLFSERGLIIQLSLPSSNFWLWLFNKKILHILIA